MKINTISVIFAATLSLLFVSCSSNRDGGSFHLKSQVAKTDRPHKMTKARPAMDARKIPQSKPSNDKKQQPTERKHTVVQTKKTELSSINQTVQATIEWSGVSGKSSQKADGKAEAMLTPEDKESIAPSTIVSDILYGAVTPLAPGAEPPVTPTPSPVPTPTPATEPAVSQAAQIPATGTNLPETRDALVALRDSWMTDPVTQAAAQQKIEKMDAENGWPIPTVPVPKKDIQALNLPTESGKPIGEKATELLIWLVDKTTVIPQKILWWLLGALVLLLIFLKKRRRVPFKDFIGDVREYGLKEVIVQGWYTKFYHWRNDAWVNLKALFWSLPGLNVVRRNKKSQEDEETIDPKISKAVTPTEKTAGLTVLPAPELEATETSTLDEKEGAGIAKPISDFSNPIPSSILDGNWDFIQVAKLLESSDYRNYALPSRDGTRQISSNHLASKLRSIHRILEREIESSKMTEVFEGKKRKLSATLCGILDKDLPVTDVINIEVAPGKVGTGEWLKTRVEAKILEKFRDLRGDITPASATQDTDSTKASA